MNKEEIKDLVNRVSSFEEGIAERINNLMHIQGDHGHLDHIEWDNSDDKVIYAAVMDRYDVYTVSFPISHLADDFDIDLYKRQVEESRKRTEELAEKAKVEKERKEYERLKAKFENSVASTSET